MPFFVLADEQHPLIAVERAQERMRRAHGGQVAPVHGRDRAEQPRADRLKRSPRSGEPGRGIGSDAVGRKEAAAAVDDAEMIERVHPRWCARVGSDAVRERLGEERLQQFGRRPFHLAQMVDDPGPGPAAAPWLAIEGRGRCLADHRREIGTHTSEIAGDFLEMRMHGAKLRRQTRSRNGAETAANGAPYCGQREASCSDSSYSVSRSRFPGSATARPGDSSGSGCGTWNLRSPRARRSSRGSSRRSWRRPLWGCYTSFHCWDRWWAAGRRWYSG